MENEKKMLEKINKFPKEEIKWSDKWYDVKEGKNYKHNLYLYKGKNKIFEIKIIKKIKSVIKTILWVLFGLPFWITFTIIYSIFVSNEYINYINEEKENEK